MSIVTIYVTVPNAEEAARIARELLARRLIACANIFPQITSIYSWKGEHQQDQEAALLLKTRASLVGPVTQAVQSLHPYDCPCISTWPSAGGNEDYFRWVHEETEAPTSPG